MYLISRAGGGGGGESGFIQSGAGEFSSPVGLVVGKLAYISGSGAIVAADNGSASTRAEVVVIGKPTSTTATVAYIGSVPGVFTGLTPGSIYFLGSAGALVDEGSLPSTSGSIIQQVGVAVDAVTLLFVPLITVEL